MALIGLLAMSAWVYAQENPAEIGPTETGVGDTLPPASAPREALTVSDLLAAMSRQQKNLNYEGMLTYQSNIGSESFRLQHWVEDGVEYQKLYYLNGPEREAVMSQHTDCHSPGARLLQERLTTLQQNLTGLEMLYNIRVRGLERVAGRVAMMLEVVPRDPYRYGYLLSIDRETGLLLKSLLFDENKRILEQFQFVELTLTDDPSAFSADTNTVIARRLDADRVAGCDVAEETIQATWALQWLPEGFTFVGQRRVRGNVDMLMYTDGLSTFSVFFDPIVGQLVIEGHAQRGATHFHMEGVKAHSGTYQMTIVGEIPLAVAERMAQSVSAIAPAEDAASGNSAAENDS